MPSTEVALVPKTYAELRRSVEATLLTGQRLIEQAKVRTYHETGRLLREHLQLHEEESNYGTQTMLRLAADLKISDSVLYRCVRFVDSFPILAARPKLTWAHYRLLIPVEDVAQRTALEREAATNDWTTDQLDDRIRPLRLAGDASTGSGGPAPTPVTKLLTPNRGTPGLHRIVDRGDGLAVDLGFKLYWPLKEGAARLRPYKAGDIVRIAADDSIRLAPEATKAELFTYAATLRRVVDGDTLVVELEVSPGVFIEQKLRLRGLDSPEMSTPEGRAAKRFVDALVAKTTAIVINTTKPDKYDRYLADVFLAGASGQSSEASAKEDETFLNNALLENGHAMRKDAADFEDDWGFK